MSQPLDSKLLDVSTFDYATFDEDCLWRDGVRRLIIGTFCRQNPPHEAADMAERWRRRGGTILAFYGFTYFGLEHYIWRDTRWAVDLAREYRVSRVMLDAELDANRIPGVTGPTPTVGQRNDQLWAVRRFVEGAGLKPLLYTYRGWWMNQHGNTAAFKDLPLVYANYGATGVNQPIEELGRLAFGGWTRATIHQYTSTVVRCGRRRDHNYLFSGLEDDMDEAATRRIVREELAKVLDLEDLAEDDDDRLRLGMSASLGLIRLATDSKVENREVALAAAKAALEAKGDQG